jgi:hypothetical protein
MMLDTSLGVHCDPRMNIMHFLFLYSDLDSEKILDLNTQHW